MTDDVCYIIHAPAVSRVKIGVSGDVERRLKSLRAGSPCPLDLVRTFSGGTITECALHGRFAEHHSHNEWFSDEILPELMALPNEGLPELPVKPSMRRRGSGLRRVHPNSMAAKKWDRTWFRHHGHA